MRNRNKINQLGRTASHRKALMANLASNLIEHKRINTTVAKAKALRGYVEPLITKSKDDTTHSRRMVFRLLQNKEAVSELFREVGPKVGERPGGYTRIIKTGFRQGDAAEMCMIELVDFNDLYTTDKKAKKTRRSRRGSGTASSETKSSAPKSDESVAAAEEVVAETTEKVVESAEAVVEEVVETAEAIVEEVQEVVESESTESTDDAKTEESEDNTEEEKKD